MHNATFSVQQCWRSCWRHRLLLHLAAALLVDANASTMLQMVIYTTLLKGAEHMIEAIWATAAMQHAHASCKCKGNRISWTPACTAPWQGMPRAHCCVSCNLATTYSSITMMVVPAVAVI